ncbi:hypothetical protein IG631_01895 [Alternaria alternata]|nr:hypothetical protein IG631_01895 [Alternaria alternata]
MPTAYKAEPTLRASESTEPNQHYNAGARARQAHHCIGLTSILRSKSRDQQASKLKLPQNAWLAAECHASAA